MKSHEDRPHVEPLVRETVTAVVVRRDPRRLRKAIAAFPDDGTMTAGYRDEVVGFLTAVYARTPVDQVLSPDRVLLVASVLAGHLLSACRRDDEEWWDYLDRAETAIESR